MARKEVKGLGAARSKPLKPIAPPPARGGGLRVGRVVSDARDAELARPPLLSGNQLGSVIREDEQRMHEELLELLSAKLAKKEKENELLRRKQEAFDRQHADLKDILQRQQREAESVRADLTSANQELQKQIQLLRLECDRLQTEGEAHRSAALEHKRLLEKTRMQLHAKTREQEATTEQLTRELQRYQFENTALEQQLVEAQSAQQAQLSKALELETATQQLQATIEQLEHDRQHLQHAHRELEQNLALELERCAAADDKFRKLEQEKQSADDKCRSLAKTLKETSAKAVEIEKKRGSLSRTEDQLTAQLAKLQKENQEIKARLAQQTTQTKHAQVRAASLETANQALDQKLKDADTEVELAHKSCREHQFRIRQLQEELVFRDKRRKADAPAVENPSETSAQPTEPIPACSVAQGKGDDENIPAWMR